MQAKISAYFVLSAATNLGLITSNASFLHATDKKKKKKENHVGQGCRRRGIEKCDSSFDRSITCAFHWPLANRSKPATCASVNSANCQLRSGNAKVGSTTCPVTRHHCRRLGQTYWADVCIYVYVCVWEGSLKSREEARHFEGTRSSSMSRLAVCKTHLALRTHVLEILVITATWAIRDNVARLRHPTLASLFIQISILSRALKTMISRYDYFFTWLRDRN